MYENIHNWSECDRMVRNLNILNKIRLGIKLDESCNTKSETELKSEIAISLKNLFGIVVENS